MAIGVWQNCPFLYFVENQFVVVELLLSLTARNTLLEVDFNSGIPLLHFSASLIQN